MKFVQENLLDFLENENSNEEDFQKLIKLLDENDVTKTNHEMKIFLQLLNQISLDHHRLLNFLDKVYQIILYYQNEIKTYFSSYEIFYIFRLNKRVVLFLFDNKFIIPTTKLCEIINKYSNDLHRFFATRNCCYYYKNYFVSEFVSLNPEYKNFFFFCNTDDYESDLELFEQNRRIGENSGHICELIRNDSIEEFIIYVNKNNIDLNSEIKISDYDTNILFYWYEATLIEYAAFFGSIQIFQYLRQNGVKLSPFLMICAIHGNNAEIIQILEDEKIINDKKDFEKCYIESIKCNHINIMNYIQENWINTDKSDKIDSFFIGLEYYNFIVCYNNFEKNININKLFLLSCKYGYYNIVDILLKNSRIDINHSTIYSICFI